MSSLRSAWTRIGLVCLVAGAVLVGTASPEATAADQMGIGEGPSDDYSRGGSNCSGDAIDPVGVMFRGKRAGLSNIVRLFDLAAYTGWGYTENDEPQGLLVKEADGKYRCQQTDASVAEAAGGPNSRFHVRLWKIPATIGTSQLKAVGTPHHEDYKTYLEAPGCGLEGGHAVDQGGIENGDYSGFDRARLEVKRAFKRNDHKVEVEQWGNTELQDQCDGEEAGSHGWGVMIWINRGFDVLAKEALATEASSSTLNGSISTEEATTEWWFTYGTRSSGGASGYPHKTAVKVISGSASVEVNAPVSGLSPNTTYYARLFARNQDGEVHEGNEIKFSTPQRLPIAAYAFDEGEGEVATDLTGNEHDGTIEGTTWTKGKYGSALQFDGIDDFVAIADSPDLQLSEEFTLEAWVRPDSAQTEAPVIEKRTTNFYSYKLLAGGETAGVPEGAVADAPFSYEEVVSEEALTNKVWSHLAMTFDGAAIRFYVNGELVDTNSAPGPQASTGALLIGGEETEDFFNGRIDEVRVYDRALDPAELAADKATPIAG